jgi:hypothetical protein
VTFAGDRRGSFGYHPVEELSDDICNVFAFAVVAVMIEVIGTAAALTATIALTKILMRTQGALRKITPRLEVAPHGIADTVLPRVSACRSTATPVTFDCGE